MATNPGLESALRDAGGTVTALLEELSGEPVDAHERRHRLIEATIPNPLRVGHGHSLLQRSAVLRGRTSARPYLYATSLLVLSRLPAGVAQRLESSPDPIGRILVEEGVAFSQAPLPASDRHASRWAEAPGVPDDYLLTRDYRLDVDEVPVMVIAEWFLPALEPFVAGP